MRKGLLGLGVVLALSVLAGCQPQQEEWQLVWEENFDQAEHFDEASWSKIPRGRSDWNNYMSDFDSCYAMRDGNLVLRGLVNYSLPVDTAPFITGGGLYEGQSRLFRRASGYPCQTVRCDRRVACFLAVAGK